MGCVGVGATLARDVPFSAVYWGLLEPIRHSMLPSDGSLATPARTITANIVAGSLGGAAAAAFSQPLVCLPLHARAALPTVMRSKSAGRCPFTRRATNLEVRTQVGHG